MEGPESRPKDKRMDEAHLLPWLQKLCRHRGRGFAVLGSMHYVERAMLWGLRVGSFSWLSWARERI